MTKVKARPFNAPNLLAFSRIALAPFMLWIIISQECFISHGYDITWNHYFAALVFVIASVTDFFDGYIARELNQATMLGAIIDPLADKMLTLAALLGLMLVGQASIWAIYIIIIRELFISGLRVVAATEGFDVRASWSGKIKTVSQMLAIGFLLMHWSGGEFLLWIAVGLTLYSGAEYVYHFRKTFLSQ